MLTCRPPFPPLPPHPLDPSPVCLLLAARGQHPPFKYNFHAHLLALLVSLPPLHHILATKVPSVCSLPAGECPQLQHDTPEGESTSFVALMVDLTTLLSRHLSIRQQEPVPGSSGGDHPASSSNDPRVQECIHASVAVLMNITHQVR